MRLFGIVCLLLVLPTQVLALTYEENFVQGNSYETGTPEGDRWNTFTAEVGVGAAANSYISVSLSGSGDPVGFTCTDPASTNTLGAALSVVGTSTSVTCDGNTWNVGPCGPGQELNVNAPSICGCINPGYIIRPTIGNLNWGGIDSATCNGSTQTIRLEFNDGLANLEPTAPVITSPPDGATVVVEGQASDPFVPMWSASTDPENDPLEYTWELWTPGPATLLLSVPTGAATQADLTMGAVAALLAANGVNVGDSIALVHRAVVTDGTNTVPGATADVTLTLASLEPTAPVITSPPDGATVVVEGQASDPFVPMWSASTDPENDPLEYTWELWTPGPTTLLLSVPTGAATQADLTMGAVAALLAANGVNVGDSIALVHRAVVTDGTNTVPGATADVTLTLASLEPTAPVITSPPDGATVVVEGQASDPFVPMWSASTDPENDPLEYTWELWTPGPTTLLLSVPTGTATQADLTMGAVAALLAANGVNVGDSIALVHRAVVTDGTNTVPGATADVTLSLGFIDNETVPVPTMGQIGTSILVLLMALAGFAGYRRLHV